MISKNLLRVEVLTAAGTPVIDVRDELGRVQNVEFSTGYPGGLYLSASMYVPRDILSAWLLRGAQRLRILNGQVVVFEGLIANLEMALATSGPGVEIFVVGHWGALMSSRRVRRLYADARTDEQTWVWATEPDYQAEQTNVIRFDEAKGESLCRLVPQGGVSWGQWDRARLLYKAPTGETIRRIDFDFNFRRPAAQSWNFRLFDGSNNVTLWNTTATGSGTGLFREPGAGCRLLYLDLISTLPNQTVPTALLDLFGEIRNVLVYATMNHTPAGGKNVVNLTEIARDVRAMLPDLSSEEDLIQSNTLSLRPFIAERFETMADLLIRAAAFGDTQQRRWAVGIAGSHLSGDAKPKLFAQPYPDLAAGHDYQISLTDPNLEGSLNLAESFIASDENAVWNYVIVAYTDHRGFDSFVTPADNATLKDDDSIAKYGRREYLLSVGFSNEAAAINYGRRFLAAHKERVWNVKQPLSVVEYIRGSKGELIPASQIQAGKRLVLQNFLRDPVKQESELVFLVTRTHYTDADQRCELTVGLPNTLDIYLAQRELVDERLAR